ncbi:MAG: hypothetical protein VXW65_02800, partial [Pseudomonadota bacterium]|nr:hypothetical protein [Pseudomonadota bacterium]
QTLRALLIEHRLSKYNVGSLEQSWPKVPAGRRCILVVGQVEDDASVRLGTQSVRTNLQLLQAVRAAHPQAFLIYKPHPDVVAGLRVGQISAQMVRQLADVELIDWPMPACLERVDEVHTMTSLTGFEALIRGVAVTCYGMPFYAGWGLTQDQYSTPRRQRRLSLDELVYAVLVQYPLYLLPQTKQLCRPEDVFAYIAGADHTQIPARRLPTRASVFAHVGNGLRWLRQRK